MRVFSESQKLISVLFFVLIPVSGFAAPAKSEAQSILLLLGVHSIAHCQFLGDVVGNSELDKETGEHPPYTTRVTDARNNLRNAAHQLGANTIHVTRTSNAARYDFPGLDKQVTFNGKAYFCDES
ncbi:MAG: DUF4156 domain-containing protein [Nitrosomonas sp.]|nr:DUF4156 domain-containing protein [Nitrosomonas sp.]